MRGVIEAVLFDLDETLILDEAVCEHAFRIAALSVSGEAPRANALARSAAAHARRLWQTLPTPALAYANRIGHSAWEGLWATYDPENESEALLESVIQNYREETWNAALEECGLNADPSRLAGLWITMRARYPVYPDADELLVTLKKRYKVGIVTNGVRGLQRRKLEGCGLMPWFDAVAVSGEVGIGKPERGIFDWIAAELNVNLEHCVMVGDNAARDVLGGNNAGIPTVWVRRNSQPPSAPPTFEVNRLIEILPWLESQS
jgi:HAD superfamily hydrolase (TIGR01509 family)